MRSTQPITYGVIGIAAMIVGIGIGVSYVVRNM